MKPVLHVPRNLSPVTRACLERLAERGHGEQFSIGGAIGLAYYHEYRSTADVDAWWEEGADEEQRARVLEEVETTLSTARAIP